MKNTVLIFRNTEKKEVKRMQIELTESLVGRLWDDAENILYVISRKDYILQGKEILPMIELTEWVDVLAGKTVKNG